MINNNAFNKILRKSEYSMYKLSRLAGIPYTTINEIHNNKIDINNCAALTVKKIAAILDVSDDVIMNEILYLNGVKGKYDGIEYIWSTDETSKITFRLQGKEVILDTGECYNNPSYIQYYNIIAGWMIREYKNSLEWKAEMKQKIKELAKDV